MVTFEDLKPTKRDAVVAVGSVVAYKLFLEKWVSDMKSRIEAYLDQREERREKARMRYTLEAQKEMLKELLPRLYESKKSEANA